MALSALIMAIFYCLGAAVADENLSDSKKQASSSASSLQAYKTPATTQKAYKIKNDGSNENSEVLQYDSRPSFNVYEDNDLDGRFGEREVAKTDVDHDGRKGEREAQLGIENVTQSQKVTILNNMGSGSLSSFKASGQTVRSSIFPEEKKPAKKVEPTESSTDSEKESDSSEDKTANQKSRVLVS